MPTVCVTAEFIIDVDADTDEEIIEESQEAVCRIDSFNTEILYIVNLDNGRTIEPD